MRSIDGGPSGRDWRGNKSTEAREDLGGGNSPPEQMGRKRGRAP